MYALQKKSMINLNKCPLESCVNKMINWQKLKLSMWELSFTFPPLLTLKQIIHLV